MPELEKFREWVEESAGTRRDITEAPLNIQLDAYVRTFPGRIIELLEELVESALEQKEQS